MHRGYTPQRFPQSSSVVISAHRSSSLSSSLAAMKISAQRPLDPGGRPAGHDVRLSLGAAAGAGRGPGPGAAPWASTRGQASAPSGCTEF